MEAERTQFISLEAIAAAKHGERRHCLEQVSGADIGRRHPIGATTLRLGRLPPADIVIGTAGVSRVHCELALHDDRLIVADLGSTNGTFIDGERITGPSPLPVGSILQVGDEFFKHELLTGTQLQKSAELDRDLAAALAYVEALLPAPLSDGPIRADWVYRPSARLGGDVFGYGYLSATRFALFLVDVSGHGASAAMHGVAVMNLLRQSALPGTDMADPGAVLAALNALFQMERHGDMYFTIWYGVYDTASRQLDYACAGHHPAFLLPLRRDDALPLRTRNALVGASTGRRYSAAQTTIPHGASLYLFSDGVFEIVTGEGLEWGLADFLPALLAAPQSGLSESQRLYRHVCAQSRTRELVELDGRLDTAGVGAIETAFAAMTAAVGQPAIVDLTRVTFLASLGVRLFISTARAVDRKGHKLVLFGATPAVTEIIETMGLEEIVPVVATQAEARARASA